MANLIYKGNKASLPKERNVTSFYLCEDTHELYFGANLYTEAVRFYNGEKPTSPAQGVLYIESTTGAGDVWNGSAWKSVITPLVKVIAEGADDLHVPTAKAAKDYVDGKIQEVAGTVNGLGKLAKKDEVSETELEATLKSKINGKAEASTVGAIESRVGAAEGKLTTLIGDDASKSVRAIANEELAAQLIAPGAAESLNTLQEIAAWIQAHPGDAAAMNQAITDLETLVGTLPPEAAATDVVGYIKEYADAAIKALKIGDYAKASDLAAAVKRIAALEANTHAHANKVELDKIAVGDKAKWDAAEQNAKDYADGLNTTMSGRMDAAEGKLTTLTGADSVAGSVAEAKKVGTEAAATAAAASVHADELNTAMDKRVKAAEGSITTLTGAGAGSVKKAEADAKAYAKAYADGLAVNYDAAGAADAAEQNAKSYVDGKDSAMNTRVQAVESALTVGSF